MLRAERVAIEEHTERRILERSMRPALSQTRVSSPRQLPTDHDYAVSTREYQSDQPYQEFLLNQMEAYQWDKLRESAAQKGMASAKGRKKTTSSKSTFPRLSPRSRLRLFQDE
jgi:hypothetical protein